MMRTSNGVWTICKVVCYLVPVAGLLTAGSLTHGLSGLLIAVAVVVIATPIIGFTRNQILLTDVGRRLATTVAEVRSLKEADSAAFTRFFTVRYDNAAINRWPNTGGAEPNFFSCPRQHLEDCSYLDDADGTATAYRPCHSSSPTFLASLTDVERSRLLSTAHSEAFPAGVALCHQDNPARHVFVITSGQVIAYVAQPGKRRCVAVRGAGDIVGERAAIEVRPRSATVVAVTAVEALVIPTSDFAVFLERHPRILAVLERQVYNRLVEDRPAVPDSHQPSSIASGRAVWSGLNCSIFLADIAAFGGRNRNDKDRQFLRAAMYTIVQHAFESSGVPWHSCHREDRGDGILIIVPPATPTSLLIDPLSDYLATALAAHNDQAAETVRIQLRVALHVGPVVSDPEGVCGESIIVAARLLDAPVLKRQLATEAADLGLIVSAYIYDTVVKHAPGQINPTCYRQVRVRVKESRLNAWMCLLRGAKS